MWNKIFTGVLGISFLLLAGLSYYSYSWLQSVSAPLNVIQNYGYFANLGWLFLWISSIALLILANVVLWTTRNSWAIWTTLLYFAIFMLTQTVWLGNSFSIYKQQNRIDENHPASGIVFGLILIILGAIIVFFDQFLIKRLRGKMAAQTVAENPTDFDIHSNRDEI